MSLSLSLKSHLLSPFHSTRVHVTEPASLYITNTLRVVATSLVGVFLPIYIYIISYSYLVFSQNQIINGLSWIICYFLLRSVFVWFTILFFSSAIFSKLHFQLSMILSSIILIGEIILWYYSESNLYLMLVAGAFAGMQVVFYWIPYHIFFLRKSANKDEKFGKKTSLRFFLTRVVSGFAPAIGGFIIVKYGFNTLFMTSIIVLIISNLPIALVIHEWKHHKHKSLDIIKNYLFKKKNLRITGAFMGEGTDAVIYAIFWPILLYFVLDNYEKIGLVNTFSFLLSSLTVLAIGKFIDKNGTKKIHGFGVFINAILYIPRMFMSSAPLFYSLDVLDRFFSGTISLPMMSLGYERARAHGGSDFILYKELAFHLGIILILTIILISFQALVSWKWVFIPAMIGSLFTMLLESDEN